jgi:hypothetical protein
MNEVMEPIESRGVVPRNFCRTHAFRWPYWKELRGREIVTSEPDASDFAPTGAQSRSSSGRFDTRFSMDAHCQLDRPRRPSVESADVRRRLIERVSPIFFDDAVGRRPVDDLRGARLMEPTSVT